MTSKQTARNYKIPVVKRFGGKNPYYLTDVHFKKDSANKSAKMYRSMGNPSRIVKVLKIGAKPTTYHYAVYRAPLKQ